MSKDKLSDWKQPDNIRVWGEGFDPPLGNSAWRDYIAYEVHPDVVSVVGRFLFPAFIEHNGGVFLKDSFTIDRYLEWEKRLPDIMSIEKVMNHRHIPDFFVPSEPISDESYKELSILMAKFLEISLLMNFTDRKFVVTLDKEE